MFDLISIIVKTNKLMFGLSGVNVPMATASHFGSRESKQDPDPDYDYVYRIFNYAAKVYMHSARLFYLLL